MSVLGKDLYVEGVIALDEMTDLVFRMHVPSGVLGQYVAAIVYHKNYNPAYEIEKLLPDGTVNLIFELTGKQNFVYDNETFIPKENYTRVFLSGMQESFISISAGNDAEMLVIQFRPGGGYPFFHMPMYEVRDLVVDGESVLGREVSTARDQFVEASDPEAKLKAVSAWLMSRLEVHQVHYAVVQHLAAALDVMPTMQQLDHVVAKTGYSHKQMIHLFKRYVGITPKRFQRITRFNRVLHEMYASDCINWSQLTYDCGFYDQSHFIREFSHFSGMNPGNYLRERGIHANYVPVKG